MIRVNVLLHSWGRDVILFWVKVMLEGGFEGSIRVEISIPQRWIVRGTKCFGVDTCTIDRCEVTGIERMAKTYPNKEQWKKI